MTNFAPEPRAATRTPNAYSRHWEQIGATQDLKRRFLAIDQQLVANGSVERTRLPSRTWLRQPDGSRQLTLFAAMTRREADAYFAEQQAQVVTRQRVLGVMRRIFETWDQHPEIESLGDAAGLAGVDLHLLAEEAA